MTSNWDLKFGLPPDKSQRGDVGGERTHRDPVGPEPMEGSDLGSGVEPATNPYKILRDQGLFGASGRTSFHRERPVVNRH